MSGLAKLAKALFGASHNSAPAALPRVQPVAPIDPYSGAQDAAAQRILDTFARKDELGSYAAASAKVRQEFKIVKQPEGRASYTR